MMMAILYLQANEANCCQLDELVSRAQEVMEAVIDMARVKKGGLERLAKEKGKEIKKLVQVIHPPPDILTCGCMIGQRGIQVATHSSCHIIYPSSLLIDIS